MKIILITLLYSTVSNVFGSNILVMMPFPTFSHLNGYIEIFKELARRGHNVTMVSPFPLKKPIPNFTDVVMKNTMKIVQSHLSNGTHDVRKNQLFFNLFGLWPVCETFLNPIFEMPEFQQFLNDKDSKFDLIILETYFCQQLFLAFGQKYKAPVVTMVSPCISISMSEISGNPHPLAYVPNLKFPFSDHMTFLERLQNTFYGVVEIIVDEFYGYPFMDKYMRKHLGQYPGFENLPSVSEMQRNISLFMLDNHFSLYYPRPYLPNVVEFGGLTIKSGGKLPADFDKYMNESKDGVIFFTWGSHFQMTNMNPKLLQAFMSVFGKLKQRVLMKWENETLPGKPDNVKIDRWFPQSSILSHPNIRLFISHGGIHGVSEAMFNEVPLLGTPLFGDQEFNLNVAVQAGMALKIDIETATEDEIYSVIKKLLEDPKFKENAKKKSSVMKDRPISALDNAVYWVEYVLRHNGAAHLKAGSLDLAWYQNLLLDVIAAFLAIIVIAMALPIFLVKVLCKLLKSKSKPIKNDSKKAGKKNKKD